MKLGSPRQRARGRVTYRSLVPPLIVWLWASSASAQFVAGGEAIPSFYVLPADGRDGTGTSADDTQAFVQVLAQMESEGGGILQLPEGIFVLHRSGPVDSVLTFDFPIIVQGVGKSNRLTIDDSTGAWIHRGTEIWLSANPVDAGATGLQIGGFGADSALIGGILFRDLTIRSSVTNRLGNAVHIRNIEESYFENVDFYTTRVWGGNGDHYYAGVLFDCVTKAGTVEQSNNVTFTNCHFWQPGPGGGSGLGQALRIESPTAGGGVRQNLWINCKFSGWSFDEEGPRPDETGDVILLQGNCDDCDLLGEVANNTFIGCSVSGHSKINFCTTHRNKWIDGIIDVNPAIGDTAFFGNYENTDNVVTGSIDGRWFDEQPHPGSKIRVENISSEAGPLFRSIQLMPHSSSQIPVALNGETFASRIFEVQAAADTFLLWVRANGSIDTLAVR